jgi:hypothetical protein
MSGRHGNQHKKRKSKSKPPSSTPVVINEAPRQEHPGHEKEDEMKTAVQNTSDRSSNIRSGTATIVISVVALLAYFTQACYMRKAMRVDQRAWISIPFPANFPLNGQTIPVVTQIINSGKTPAKGVLVDVFASPLSKSDKATVGEFSVGHPHERLHAPGVIFPRDPIPVNISVGSYLPQGGQEATVPDETLRQDIASGKRYILFYGRATYRDVFEIEHYTQFCTGTGSGIPSDVFKDCLSYNDVDSNEE